MRVLVASERACEKFQPRLVKLLKAQFEGVREVRRGGAFDGLDLVLRREKMDDATFYAALDKWEVLDVSANLALLGGESPKLAEIAGKLEEQMLRAGLLKKRPTTGRWIDASFVKEVAP